MVRPRRLGYPSQTVPSSYRADGTFWCIPTAGRHTKLYDWRSFLWIYGRVFDSLAGQSQDLNVSSSSSSSLNVCSTGWAAPKLARTWSKMVTAREEKLRSLELIKLTTGFTYFFTFPLILNRFYYLSKTSPYRVGVGPRLFTLMFCLKLHWFRVGQAALLLVSGLGSVEVEFKLSVCCFRCYWMECCIPKNEGHSYLLAPFV